MKAGKVAAISCGALLGLGVLMAMVGSCTASMVATRQAAQEAADKKRREDRRAEEEKKFAAMTSEQHAEEARKALDSNQTALASKHLSALPQGFARAAEMHERLSRMEAKAKTEQAAKDRAAEQEIQQKMLEARKEFAQKLETNYLDKGLNIEVTTLGKNADVLKLKWALTSKVAAHQIGKSDLVDTAKALGFKKVWLTNGFSSSLSEGYTWDLTKP